MQVTHRTRTQELTAHGSELFLLANKKGGYALLGNDSFSHFAGVCFLLPKSWEQVKTIDNISLDRKPASLVNKFYGVDRFSGGAREEFFFFDKTFFYSVDQYHGGVTVDLDMRRLYDSDDQDRIYKMYWEDGLVIVEYAHKDEEYFLAIRGADSFAVLNAWQPRSYAYDAARGLPNERWVYRALRFDCSGSLRLSFSFGQSKEAAIAAARTAFDDWELTKSQLKAFARSIKTTNGVAYSSAVFALESLIASVPGRTGVFAGLPWFFHFWSRDELISLQGLVHAEKYALVKDILLRYVGNLLPDGRLPNRVPGADLGSADAVGWLWKRLGDFLEHLEERKLLWEYWSHDELSQVLDRLEASLRQLSLHHLYDGLVMNAPLETWMDTRGGTDDVRAGARVEVQALTLAALETQKILQSLLKRPEQKWCREFESSLHKRTREHLFTGVLHDGLDHGVDKTVRPNVFIAAYAYPTLLTKKEWSLTFQKALESLWLDWGGLSSIDKKHALFSAFYTGENNKSYHRGDSWFFVNNLAAIAMHRVNPEQFRYHVEAIKKASVHDLLWEGCIGHASELSSAKKQQPGGCFGQAWSAATLIELLEDVGE